MKIIPDGRKEDYRFITGHGTFIDDLKPAGTLFVCFVRSPYGHAKIRSIKIRDTESGSFLTGKDIDYSLPMISTWPGTPLPAFPLLARDKVLYAGQLVAAVVAGSRSEAEDLIESVEVEYDNLPTVIDAEEALKKDASLVHASLESNLVGSWKHRSGDFDKCLEIADVVIEEKFYANRVTGQAIEPRAAIAEFDKRVGKLTVWLTSQCPHMDRTLISECVKIPEEKIKVIARDVGGGFGINSHLYPEQLVTSVLALKLGRPVKWIEDRREHIAGAIHSGDCTQWVTIAATNDGKILGMKEKILQNVGAYFQTRHIVSTFVTGMLITGPYKIPNYSSELIAVFSNKGPVGTYRAFGMTQATFARETVIDSLARKIGIDPLDVRMKNLIEPEDFPYLNPAGLLYDSGNYQKTISKALGIAGYYDQRKISPLLTKNLITEERNNTKNGVGMAIYLEIGGVGVLDPLPTKGQRYSPYESARVRLEPDGGITVFSGVAPTGQGLESTLALIASEELSVPIEQIRVVYGDTDLCPYSGDGTIASRSANMAGNAVFLACRQLKEKMLRYATIIMNLNDNEELVFGNGRVYSKKDSSKMITFSKLFDEISSALSETAVEEVAYYEPKMKSGTTAYGIQFALVEVDEETGLVRVKKLVTVHDCGREVNPSIVEGMAQGGVAQGVSAALFEEVSYAEDGSLLGTTLGDYLIPTSMDMPISVVNNTVTLSPTNPLGVKGGGEGGIIGAPAAIANAISDAFFPIEMNLSRLPIRPEMVRILHK